MARRSLIVALCLALPLSVSAGPENSFTVAENFVKSCRAYKLGIDSPSGDMRDDAFMCIGMFTASSDAANDPQYSKILCKSPDLTAKDLLLGFLAWYQKNLGTPHYENINYWPVPTLVLRQQLETFPCPK
ncbi:hypothetical protein [Rhizobium sp.]|uniref:hypothetical protein n=1 Tax=Rhizobium sp. TaxID=391 RepID=UPI003F7E36A7